MPAMILRPRQRPSHELRYAMVLATPDHPGTDCAKAQQLLRELIATQETLLPAERAMAFLTLQNVDQTLSQTAENQRLQASADHSTIATASAAVNRRLQSEMEAAGRKCAPAQGTGRRPCETGCHRQYRTGFEQAEGPGGNTTVTIASKRKARILVVDDDPGLLRLLTIRLRAESYDVEAVEGGPQALAAASRFRPDLVITDLRMEPMDGIALLKELQNRWPGLKVIMLTAHGTIPDAVQATQMGAFGFLTKPVDKQELLDQVQKALRISGFGSSDEDWRAEIVTRSSVMEEKLAQAHMVAGTDARVLITGESGTGKELLARAIHQASPRRNKEFVAVNCSAMAPELLESELFGHEKGAFTGAVRAHEGLFRAADGGTLMLDEIGDMPMPLQVKLLRVLQENVVRPVGSTTAIPVNVRVISATHRDLQALMQGGVFREDLYYRLNVVHIEMPALNRRREDIPLLVAHFLAHAGQGQRRTQDLRARRRWNCWPRPTGPAISASCRMSCARTSRCRKRPSFRWNWCSSPSAAARASCLHSMRRAMNSRAATCRRSCRSPAAM